MNLSWFTTIPGMLITGGVLLLIIALIIFIATSTKKGKKNQNDATVTPQPEQTTVVKEQPESMPTVVMPQEQPQVTPSTVVPQPTIEQPTGFANPLFTQAPIQQVEAPIENSNVITTPEVAPIPVQPIGVDVTTPQSVVETPMQEVSMVPPIPVSPEQEIAPAPTAISNPVPVAPIENFDQSTPSVEVAPSPAVEAVEPVLQDTIIMPQVEAVPPTEIPPVTEPVVEAPVEPPIAQTPVVNEESTQTPEPIPQPEPQSATPIYGGVSQIIPNLDMNPEPERQIYGGANPLENTQSVPVQPQPVVETPQSEPSVVESPVSSLEEKQENTEPVSQETPIVTPTQTVPITPVVEAPVEPPIAPSTPTKVVEPVAAAASEPQAESLF